MTFDETARKQTLAECVDLCRQIPKEFPDPLAAYYAGVLEKKILGLIHQRYHKKSQWFASWRTR